MYHTKLRLFVPVLLALVLSFQASAQTRWNVYEYHISFKIKNAGISVSGTFSGLNADILFSQEKPASSSIKASVASNTLATGIGKRDHTIKKEKYLNVDTFKVIEAVSTKIYTKDNDYAGMFNITIKGTTKEIEIPFKFLQFGDLADFTGEFSLNRRDFNVGGSSMTMSDNVDVRFTIKARK